MHLSTLLDEHGRAFIIPSMNKNIVKSQKNDPLNLAKNDLSPNLFRGHGIEIYKSRLLINWWAILGLSSILLISGVYIGHKITFNPNLDEIVLKQQLILEQLAKKKDSSSTLISEAMFLKEAKDEFTKSLKLTTEAKERVISKQREQIIHLQKELYDSNEKLRKTTRIPASYLSGGKESIPYNPKNASLFAHEQKLLYKSTERLYGIERENFVKAHDMSVYENQEQLEALIIKQKLALNELEEKHSDERLQFYKRGFRLK